MSIDMDEDLPELLDSPKKAYLQNQSIELRTALKHFERTFAEQNKRKPKQNDIKNDPSIASKYKQYRKVQDVLAGKLAYEELKEVEPTRKSKSRTHSRQDSGIGSSPRKQQRNLQSTPRKSSYPYELDPYDAPTLISSKPVLLNAIGPTPHRDGKALGLFDLIQRSGSSRSPVTTPSLSVRKRKIDELYQDTPATTSPLKPIQNPSHRSSKEEGDLLQFLGETPQKCSGNGNGKHSRTPQSEGKKFHLSHFFATPSTQRFLFSNEDDGTTKKTPLRDVILGRTPQKQPITTGLDVTPTYLRRSTSFKDRLLSASKTTIPPDFARPSPAAKRIGPPTIRHFRSSTSNIFTASDTPQLRPEQQHQHQEQVDDDLDDDLEALRELEGQCDGPHVLVEDSQLGLQPSASDNEDGLQPTRPYKKKGQKRTTRRSNIRPVANAKASAQPKFVAVDGSDEEEEGDIDKEERRRTLDDEQGSDSEGSALEDDQPKSKVERRKESGSKQASKTTKTPAKPRKQAGMINPNAQSHQNFRSLKIKGKSSNAKGAGRGRFGRSRRK